MRSRRSSRRWDSKLPTWRTLPHERVERALISHFPVQNLLYLSGTTPRKNGEGYLAGVGRHGLTLEQGREAGAHTRRSRRWRP